MYRLTGAVPGSLTDETGKAGIRWRVLIVLVASDRHSCRGTSGKVVVANLHSPSYHLHDQQTSRYKPPVVSFPVRFINLHARLVKILNLPHATGRLCIALAARHQTHWSPY